MKKKTKGIIVCCVLAVVAVLTLLLSIARVPAGYTGIVVSFGKVEEYTLDSGVHIKKPWQSVIRMNNRVQKETIELCCFSKDIQETNMVFSLNYQISKKNASMIYLSIGKNYFETVISPSISESVKTVVANYTAEELITDRSRLAKEIEADLSAKLVRYNIELVDTSIEDIDFTDAYTDAVEAKQVAQQNKLKAETEAETKVIQANADAEVRKINADAEAYVNVTTSESLTKEILTKMYYEKWNGVLPQIVSDGSMIMIPKDN